MTDPKNPEAQNEELDLEQLEDAAGGIGTTSGPGGTSYLKQNISGTSGPGGTTFLKQNVSGTSGPGGTSYPKTNLGGSADPRGDDI